MPNIKIALLLTVALLVITGCTSQQETDRTGRTHGNSERHTIKKAEPSYKKSITISAIGDLLIHKPVYEEAKTESGYSFTSMFENVKEYTEETTIAVANQETMIGGEEIKLSGYPFFNSPYEMGDALKDIGIDIVSLANNHTLDRGETAIRNAISYWKEISMIYMGAYENKKDQETIRVIETEAGISVAFLSYTYGTNGIPVPEGKDYLVNIIDLDMIRKNIKKAKGKADAVVVSIHFGKEYERMPNQSQKMLAQMMVNVGADVILGHHPHVLQPIEKLKGENGHEGLVIYSLGNFISAQEDTYRRIGGIFQFEVVLEDDKDEVNIEKPVFIPTVVDYDPLDNNEAGTNFKVIPMSKAENDVIPELETLHKEIKQHMAKWLPELEFK
ncbi:CapA family protein [Halobacillus litoralis]|uniref:Capsular biosynthesis protein n=1 Tax=Halobacillus litoralis TaxID=45668 RepID=A0A410MEH9_9BACI|nr:CapA family protein [Halobacillus litoralis]QAS53149.1 capsular biosynthesis protein [Halobacillus litoralis]